MVRDAAGGLRYAYVAFTEEEISGIELLRRSRLPVLTAGFGGLGEAVCDIGGTGCDLAECQRRLCQGGRPDDPFWQTYQQVAPGEWRPFALGASSVRVRDGDIVGWSWTGTEPNLPAITLTEIADLAAAPVITSGPAAMDWPRTLAAALVLVGIGGSGAALTRRAAARPARRPLDPRAWLLWYLAASLPVLIGRNPFTVLAVLFAALCVRAVWGASAQAAAWAAVLRLAFIFAVVSTAFNLLTVHAGDRVLGALPAHWPVVGGIITVNALVYGGLSGVALFTLVLLGTTLAIAIEWATVLRLLPGRLATLAVAGAVAWTLVPATLTAFTEIREAQLARGHRLRGPRGLLPSIVPLVGGGLERALTTAEVLEARGFGAVAALAPPSPAWRRRALGGGLGAIIIGAYLLAAGYVAWGAAVLGAGGLALWQGWRTPPGTPQRTRYREPVWAHAEWLVAGSAAGVLAMTLAGLAVTPAAFVFNPYPILAMPDAAPALIAGLGLLLMPVVARP